MNQPHDPMQFTAETDEAALSRLREDEARWRRETRGPVIDAHGERKDSFRTQTMDWEIEPLYTPLDLADCGFGKGMAWAKRALHALAALVPPPQGCLL